MKTTEERIERLEEDHYFLQEKLQQLDDVVTEQQKELTALTQELSDALTVIGRLRASIDELRAGKTDVQLEIPPHYGKW